MKTTIVSLLLATSTLLIGTAAHADESAALHAKTVAKAIYEGVSQDGGAVRLIIADVGVDTFRRTDAVQSARIAGPHWSARIGAGMQPAKDK